MVEYRNGEGNASTNSSTALGLAPGESNATGIDSGVGVGLATA